MTGVGPLTIISHPDSRVKALVVPTNEERMIALDTLELARATTARNR